MLQRQNLYVAKTKYICCKDKKHGARAERARRGFFLPEKDILIFWEDNIAVFVLCTDKTPLKSTVLGLSAPAGAFFSQKETFLFFENTV